MKSASNQVFLRCTVDGEAIGVDRALAAETPIAIEVNGLGYAVLMASPLNLDDLTFGFLLSERIIVAAADIMDVDIHDVAAGTIVRVTVVASAFERVSLRVRHRTSDSSCGLCGIENLEQALRPLPRLTELWAGTDDAIFAALSELPDLQTLNRTTGAVHAAACCTRDGRIIEIREDVGRHNAFDKLIGAMLRANARWDGGFALLTSRCSYELVEKAVLSHCPLLATISAPTDLAVRRAAEAGLALRVLVRSDALLTVPS
jgi:FdhD protein